MNLVRHAYPSTMSIPETGVVAHTLPKAPCQPVPSVPHHGRRVLSHFESTRTVLTANTDSAPVEIIRDIFRHALHSFCSTVTRSPASSSMSAPVHCSFSPVHTATDALLPHLIDRHLSPDLLRLHLERSAVLRLNAIITDPHPVTHSIICDEAYRFRRFIVDDMKLSPIWGDALPSAASHLEEL